MKQIISDSVQVFLIISGMAMVTFAIERILQ